MVWLVTEDLPSALRRVGAEELAYIASERSGERAKPSLGKDDLRGLLANYLYWLAVSYHVAVLALYFGLTTRLPKYLATVLMARGY